MKRFLPKLLVRTLAVAGALSVAAFAQTTQEGSGPSEHPSAPMEMGQPQAGPPAQAGPPSQQGKRPRLQQTDREGQAQEGGPSGEGPAKTEQGVGRISLTHGDVSTQRGDSGTWSAAVVNQPVVSGDKVSTAEGGRAEVQLDYANILRLGSNSQANIANFTNDRIQIQVSQGLVNYSVFGESEAEPEIDTPNVAVHPAHQDGIFRIEVRPDGDSIIIVRKGEAQIATPQGITEIKAGDMATIRGSGADARYKITPAPDRDDWDRWNIERDRMIHEAKGYQHTNKYYVGAEDLDANGRWENADDYGQVWVPNEPDGWAPYRDGTWDYEPYYGWTWVGYEPWGWAPYHYGRWMYYGNSWAWWPGPVWGAGFYRPFWAPAYVSFFGFGGGWGFDFGWGGWAGFGWLPIGPCDRFFPWWGGYGGRFGVVGFNRFDRLNRLGGFAPLHGGTRYSNIAHINNINISRGVSTVGASQFGAGHVTAVAATHDQITSAHMMTGNMPVIPTRASLSASSKAAAPSSIHESSSQHFFGTQATAHAESFQEQTSHLQQSMQQNHFSPVTAGRTTAAESRASSSSTSASSSARQSSSAQASGKEAASSTGRAEGNQSSTNRSESSGEWKSFTPASHNQGSTTPSGSGNTTREESGSYWNRTAPSSTSSRESSAGSYDRGTGSHPQLNMRQPIVQPRSSQGSGGYHGDPGGGSHSAPSSGGASHPSGGGGGGGGHPPGGGGHH